MLQRYYIAGGGMGDPVYLSIEEFGKHVEAQREVRHDSQAILIFGKCLPDWLID
jgi:hypothetical protein